MESDFSNAIAWVSNIKKANPLKFQFYFNEIKELLAHKNISFCHVFRFANSTVDVLAKQRVDRLGSCISLAHSLLFVHLF